MRALVLLFALTLGQAAHAQQASYTVFGTAHGAGCANLPVSLKAIGTPRLGSDFTLEVHGCSGSQPFAPWLAWGVTNQHWFGVSLPIDLGTPGSFNPVGGEIHVSLDILQTAGYFGPSVATWTISIPSTPSILGASFYNQSICQFRSACSGMRTCTSGCWGGVTFSQAGHGVIGL